MVRRFILVIFTITGLVPSIAFAQASDRIDLSVSPTSLDLTTQPGGVIKDRIRIHNNANVPVNLVVSVKKVTPTNQDPGFILTEPDARDEFVKWVQVETPRFTIPPNEWFNVPFSITVPDHAAFGYYPAFVFNEENTAGNATEVISGGVAVLTALRVQAPGSVVQGELLEFQTQHTLNEWLPAEFLVTVRNTGNIHMKPRGNIFISAGEGEDTGILEVNLDLSTVIPNSSRTFMTSWNDGFITREPVLVGGEAKLDKKGRQVTKLTVHWENISHMRIGKYTARLLMVYDNGTRDITLDGVVTFWVFPYKLFLVLILLLLILILGTRFLLRMYIRGLVNKEKATAEQRRIK